MKRAAIIAVAAALPWIVAGCGEGTQVTVYKQGRYQGKAFNDDQRCGQVWVQAGSGWQLLSEHCAQIQR